MYCQSSDNKGVDQLWSYPEADLCLCIYENPVFTCHGSFYFQYLRPSKNLILWILFRKKQKQEEHTESSCAGIIRFIGLAKSLLKVVFSLCSFSLFFEYNCQSYVQIFQYQKSLEYLVNCWLIIPSLGLDKSEQTVQTQIILILEKQSDQVFTVAVLHTCMFL